MSLDRNWHIGVPGWKLDGRHVRLADILDAGGGEREVREHLNSMLLLAMVYHKLKGEYDEIKDNL